MTDYVHHQAVLNGLDYHFVTAGDGIPVLLLHGFPDLWIGWRGVMEQLVERGFRVIAPDLRGFGQTAPAAGAEQATAIDVMGDLVALLDHLAIDQVAVVAHDWGAEIGWTIAKLRPDRFAAIVALSVPYAPRGPASLPQMMARAAPPDLYMLYFLEEGRAERELDANPRAFLRRLFYTNSGDWAGDGVPAMRLAGNGSLIEGLDEPPTSWLGLSEQDLAYYVEEFSRTGFRAALNTYRSLHRNWQLMAGWADRTIEVPALYIGGSRDIVLHFPGMRDLVEAMPRLMKNCEPPVIVEGAGHFIQLERPRETAQHIADFLEKHIAALR
ncbi:alpha/beta fold hydrolase [Alteraurantiacibacter buctensis]|uniref:Alpha/beta fold hydrolase n=1 Tax=Alteraurantiacibacter buctensis TaxID=1503981 RepID=A0A844Z0Z5_9SPHN|nr:alpha/beta hydrolase [Alteraurantiacibacter buctensis]MXO73018.1 alpha/beta fold hydrolase [Alteraurantiacibacter buctensis]